MAVELAPWIPRQLKMPLSNSNINSKWLLSSSYNNNSSYTRRTMQLRNSLDTLL